MLNERRDADIDAERRRRLRGACTSPASARPTTSRTRPSTSRARESEFLTGVNLPLDGGSSAARGPRCSGEPDAADGTARLGQRDLHVRLDRSTDLAFYAAHGHHQRRHLGREARAPRLGRRRAPRRATPGCASPTSSGSVRSTSPSRTQWDAAAGAARARARRGATVGAECLVFTTGPGRAAAVGGGRRRARDRDGAGARRVARARRPVRDRAHQLAARRRRVRAHARATSSTSPAGSAPACAWRSTRAGPSAASRRRSRDGVDTHPARAGERLRGRHAVDAEPARPRRRRHPARPDPRPGARRRLRGLLRPRAHRARRSTPRATTAAVPRAVDRARRAARRALGRARGSASQVTGPKWKPLVASSALASARAGPAS